MLLRTHTHTHRTQETWQGCWWERKASAVLCASENTDRHTAHSGAGCLVEETVRLLANCFVCSPRSNRRRALHCERFNCGDGGAKRRQQAHQQSAAAPSCFCLPSPPPVFKRGPERARLASFAVRGCRLSGRGPGEPPPSAGAEPGGDDSREVNPPEIIWSCGL